MRNGTALPSVGRLQGNGGSIIFLSRGEDPLEAYSLQHILLSTWGSSQHPIRYRMGSMQRKEARQDDP